MTFRTIAVSAVALGALIAPASAAAVDSTPQLVEATAAPSLGVTIPGPITIATLKQGNNSFTASPITVVAPLGSWSLSVGDADNLGVLQQQAGTCTGSAANVGAPLTFAATTTLATTTKTGSGTVDASEPLVTSVSSLADVVNVTYGVDVPDTQQLADGCLYGTSLTYTLTAL